MTTGLGLLAEALVVGFVSMPVRGRHRELQSNMERCTRSIRVGGKVGSRGDLPERCQA